MARFKNPMIDKVEHFDKLSAREVRQLKTVTKTTMWGRLVDWLLG